jgi:hypothetical protein
MHAITISFRDERGAKTGDEKRVSLISRRRFILEEKRYQTSHTAFSFQLRSALHCTTHLHRIRKGRKVSIINEKHGDGVFLLLLGLACSVWSTETDDGTEMALDYGYTHVTNFLL